MIPRDTLNALFDTTRPQWEKGRRVRTFLESVTSTGYAHGYAAATGDPWDYDASEVAHAIAEWEYVALAREYSRHYAQGFAQGEADRATRRERLDRGAAALANRAPTCRTCGRADDLHIHNGIAQCHPCMLDADLARHIADQRQRRTLPTA